MSKLATSALAALGILGLAVSPAFADEYSDTSQVKTDAWVDVPASCSFGEIKDFGEGVLSKGDYDSGHDLYSAVAFDGASVWLSCNAAGEVVTQIDPSSGSILAGDAKDHVDCTLTQEADLDKLDGKLTACWGTINSSFDAWDQFPSGIDWALSIETKDGRPLPAGRYHVDMVSTATVIQ